MSATHGRTSANSDSHQREGIPAHTEATPAAEWSPVFKPIAPLAFAVIGLLMLAGFAAAQDPPVRVGRLSDVGGSVFLAQDNSQAGWQPVGINYPVTGGDNVWVSSDGRAEIDYGGGQLRLAQEANVHFSQLDERIFSAFIANGRASLRLRTLDRGEVAKLDTPTAQIDLLRPGTYRLDTSADANQTTLIVRDGEADVRVGDRRMTVRSGQTAMVQAGGQGTAISVRDGIGTDGFDQYAMDRDRRLESGVQAEQYVSSSVPGVADLDLYGRWETVPTYGAVWYPTAVAPDWTPYQDGSWTYVQPWGWTWVDNAPWGWVPFHYGRWVRIGPRWAWCPGAYERRPVYAPALVAWFGGPAGTAWSVGFGRPTFGWVPLSWGEPYWPHYRHTSDYWRRHNHYVGVNVRQVPQRPPQRYQYANARVPGAVVAAPVEVLTHRRPVGPNRYTVPPQQLASAPVTTAPLAVRPAARPGVIDKMPERAPEPASAYASRLRPDMPSPSTMGSAGSGGSATFRGERGPDGSSSGTQGPRGGVAGTPYVGPQPGAGSTAPQPTPAVPIPSPAISSTQPTPAVPLPSATITAPQQGSIQPMPQPMPAQPAPAQQPTVNRATASQIQQPQPLPIAPAQSPSPPTVNRPTPPQIAVPQPVPQPQLSVRPSPQLPPPQMTSPATLQPLPAPTPQVMPHSSQPMPSRRPPSVPVTAMPVAPGPSSIAPAPSSIAPAGGSIAPAGGSIAAPPQRVAPQRPHGPRDSLPVQPATPLR